MSGAVLFNAKDIVITIDTDNLDALQAMLKKKGIDVPLEIVTVGKSCTVTIPMESQKLNTFQLETIIKMADIKDVGKIKFGSSLDIATQGFISNDAAKFLAKVGKENFKPAAGPRGGA